MTREERGPTPLERASVGERIGFIGLGIMGKPMARTLMRVGSSLVHKDLGIALAAGRTYGVPLPVTALVDQMLLELRMKGRGNLDHSALLTILEEGAQHEIAAAG